MKSFTTRTELFSKAIAERLASLDMDVETFTRSLGLRQTFRVLQWVQGTELPADHHIVRIALVLDMDPADVLLLWAGYPPDQPIPEPEEPFRGGVSLAGYN